MKICIDATPIGINTTDKGGVYRYIHHLVEALGQIDKENQYRLFFNFFNNSNLPAFEKKINQLDLPANFLVQRSRCPVRIREGLGLPVEFLAGGFDVFHGCADRLPKVTWGKAVVTIHDVRYLEDFNAPPDPEWMDIIQRKAPRPKEAMTDFMARDALFKSLRETIKQTVKRADKIIAVSEFSKSRMIDTLNIEAEKIRVVHHGVDTCFKRPSHSHLKKRLEHMGIKTPYVLYTGKYDPLKNLLRLLSAFKICSDKWNDLMLVMAGPKNWFYYVVEEESRRLGIGDRIYYTDFISDEDLVTLYSGASLFAMPSLYEGFGMPVIEAMACGAPVVTSRLCSIPEVAGDAALLVDPESVSDIAEAMMSVLSDKKISDDLVAGGLMQASSFTWEKSARETLSIYEREVR